MQREEPLSPVQDCLVDKVTFQGNSYLRKQIALNEQISFEKIREALVTLDNISHPNIAKVLWYVHVPSNSAVFLLMPVVYPLLSLRNAVLASHIPDWPLRIKIAIDVALALRHLHHFNMAFGDLRPESVLIVSLSFSYLKFDGSYSAVNAVLSDLGEVGGFCLTRLLDYPTDSFPYIAPELITKGADGKPKVNIEEKQPASDMYAFGMILYILASQQVPFADSRSLWGNTTGLLEQVATSGLRPNLEPVQRSCPQPILQLMQSCWATAPASRPTADKAIEILYKAITPFIVEDPNWKTVAADARLAAAAITHVELQRQLLMPSVSAPAPSITPAADIPLPSQPPPPSATATTAGVPHSTAEIMPPSPTVVVKDELVAIVQPGEPTSIALDLPVVVESAPPVPTAPAPPVPATPPPPTPPPPQHSRTPTSPAPILLAGSGASMASTIVRVVGEVRPVQVRVAKDSTNVQSLLEALKRSRVQTEGRALMDAASKVALTDGMLFAMLNSTNAVTEVALLPTTELVEVHLSLSSATEDEPIISLRFHYTAKASEIVAGFCLSGAKGKFHILLPDCTAASDTEEILVDKHGAVPVEIVLAPDSELEPVTFRLALAGEEERSLSALIHQSTTLAAASRWALKAFGVDPGTLPYPLELLGPLRNAVPDPAAVTVQACFAGAGSAAGRDLWLRDGELVQVVYKDASCSVLLPAAVSMTIAELIGKACRSLELGNCGTNEHFVSTSKGVALLDVSAPVDRQFHAAQGLRLCDQSELVQVTVNENFAVGFARGCNPTVQSLTETMGLDPTTPIEFRGVIQDPTALLVPDGSYTVADITNGSFRTITIEAAGTSMALCAHLSCTLANLLQVALLKSKQQQDRVAFFIDTTDSCLLDETIQVGDLPQTAKLAITFV